MAEHQPIQEGRLNKCPPKAEDVACNFCIGIKRRATKSCLDCLVSYCKGHLKPHYHVPQFKRHKLTEPSTKLQENICNLHGERRRIFCCTDQQCVCYLCALGEHKDHKTVPAAEEMTKRKEEIGPRCQEIKKRLQDTEKAVAALQKEEEDINHFAQKAVTDSQKLSTNLIHRIKRRSVYVARRIRAQQKIKVGRVKRLQEKLNQDLAELKKTDAELKRLSRTEDQTHFLHKFVSLPGISELSTLPQMNKRPLRYFGNFTAAVSGVIDTTKEHYDKKWKKIPKKVADVDVLLPQNPETRAECSQHAVQRFKVQTDLKLDPNTAHMLMILSEDNRKATLARQEQPYPDHPDRFRDKRQVLSAKSLTGRCYWEVKWSGLGSAVAVAYKDIAREGEESTFGNNDKSWVLSCNNGKYTFKHDNTPEKLEGKRSDVSTPGSSRLGVFIDSKAGVLSFYEVSDTFTRLHTVQTTFTQPVCAGLGVYHYGSSAEFCNINQRNV